MDIVAMIHGPRMPLTVIGKDVSVSLYATHAASDITFLSASCVRDFTLGHTSTAAPARRHNKSLLPRISGDNTNQLKATSHPTLLIPLNKRPSDKERRVVWVLRVWGPWTTDVVMVVPVILK
jgi:hypothetical protein